jgi:hypothetical protein
MDQEQDRPQDTQPISFRRIQAELGASEPVPADVDALAQNANGTPGYQGAVSEQDDIPTPRPMNIERPNDVEKRSGCSTKALWAAVIVSLIIGLISLALNAALIASLLSVRSTAVDGLDAAIAALDNFGQQGFQYEYHFNETVPFSGDIPFKQEMVFPFKGDIPINTVVSVPIDAGALGTFNIDVPIDTSFYVDLEVPISVDQTIHVDTEIPLDMVIPIAIQADDPMIQGIIGQVQGWLLELRSSF